MSTHYQYIQNLAIEMFKVVKGGNTEIVNEIFRDRKEGFDEVIYFYDTLLGKICFGSAAVYSKAMFNDKH